MNRLCCIAIAIVVDSLSFACFNPRYQEGISCSDQGACPEGLTCDPVDNRCRAEVLDAACTDGIRNGAETDIDCGGGACSPCADGLRCQDGSHCESQVCDEDGMCAAPVCGDRAVNGEGEDCDDGEESASCDADCTTATCGDGTINATASEECDDGGESAACDSDCTPSMCGDGLVNTSADELCDDGGASPDCNADCTPTSCGDGMTNMAGNEECDDAGESATCDDNCTFVSCGDGTRNATAGEECDDGGESAVCDLDCTAQSCGDGTINMTAGEGCDDSGESAACNADCSPAMCGDGTLNMTAGETCDDGAESVTCNADCTAALCGDGVLNMTAGENCDDGGESATCNIDCTVAMCGDGVINGSAGEQCDDGNTDDADSCSNACVLQSQNCLDIITVNPSATDGVYAIDPDGPGGLDEFDVYCDMTTDGGGWTVTAYLRQEPHWDWLTFSDQGTVGDIAGGFASAATLNASSIQFTERIIIYNRLIELGVDLGKQWMLTRRADDTPVSFPSYNTPFGWSYRDSFGFTEADAGNVCTHNCSSYRGLGMFHDISGTVQYSGTQTGNYGCVDGNNICWMARSLGCNVGSNRCSLLAGSGEGVVYGVR